MPATDYNGDGLVNGADIARYVVGDGLSSYVTYQDATLSIVDETGAELDTLVAGTDYAVAAPAAGTAGGPVTFTFTEAGLDKLMAAKADNADAVVRTDVVATVTSLPANGLVPNEAYFIPSQNWYDSATNPDEGIPSNEVVSKYGDILINKSSSAAPAPESLAGAVFSLYRSGDNATCEDTDFVEANLLGTATTNDDGQVEFSGLQLSNWINDSSAEDGEIEDPANYNNYCLVETTALPGHQLLADPITVSLTQEGVTEELDGQPVDVVNHPDTDLPLTGGQGVALLSVVGLLVAGGLGYYLISRRKNA